MLFVANTHDDERIKIFYRYGKKYHLAEKERFETFAIIL